MKKIWLLQPINPNAGPWSPWYDKAFGFVVRADTEAEARAIADRNGGDECGGYVRWEEPMKRAHQPWLDPTLASCVELTGEGESEVVLRDFASA